MTIESLNLPEDYNFVQPGDTSIQYGCPWLVPEAIQFLFKVLKSTWSVLEVGSGGSSIFFGKRCQSVTAIENFKPYYDKMKTALDIKFKTKNIDLQYTDTENLLSVLGNITKVYDVISIDHGVHYPSRSECLNKILNRWNGNVFIFDNWSKKPAWPEHHKLSHIELKNKHPSFKNCKIFDFYHNKWAGSGTRIAINEDII